MKVVKSIFNVLGIFMAMIFSLILSAMLLVTPMVSAASSFLKADTLHKVVKNIDLSELFSSLTGTEVPTEFNGIDISFLEDAMDSELIEDVLTLYVDSIFSTIEGDSSQTSLSTEAVENIIEKHLDELLPVVKSYIGTDLPLSDDSLRAFASPLIKSMVPDLISALPTLEDLGLNSTAITILQNLYNGTYFVYMVCATALFSLLIVLFRFPRFKGFMWLGVVYLICAVLVLVLALLTKTSDILTSVASDLSVFEFVITPLLTALSAELFKDAGIIAVLGVVFILIFVLGRKLTKKKNTLQTLAA